MVRLDETMWQFVLTGCLSRHIAWASSFRHYIKQTFVIGVFALSGKKMYSIPLAGTTGKCSLKLIRNFTLTCSVCCKETPL